MAYIEQTSRRLSSAKNTSTALIIETGALYDRVESMRPWDLFKGCRLARMSDGHYRLLRNLGR
jgi:hypothetical protein